MACRKTARRAGTKKRAQRATSNVFAMFDQDQIQEFKEAFNMIDQNRDGFIDHDDLKDMLASLGKVRKAKGVYNLHMLQTYIVLIVYTQLAKLKASGVFTQLFYEPTPSEGVWQF